MKDRHPVRQRLDRPVFDKSATGARLIEAESIPPKPDDTRPRKPKESDAR